MGVTVKERGARREPRRLSRSEPIECGDAAQRVCAKSSQGFNALVIQVGPFGSTAIEHREEVAAPVNGDPVVVRKIDQVTHRCIPRRRDSADVQKWSAISASDRVVDGFACPPEDGTQTPRGKLLIPFQPLSLAPRLGSDGDEAADDDSDQTEDGWPQPRTCVDRRLHPKGRIPPASDLLHGALTPGYRKGGNSLGGSGARRRAWRCAKQRLNFLPLPHGHGSLRPNAG